jgi:hypothetical protein
MYSIIPIHRNIKSALASPGRSRVGPAFYVFSFLDKNDRRHVVLLERRSIMTTHFGKYSKRSPPCLWSGSPHLGLPGIILRRWNVRLRLSGYSLTPPLRCEISKLDVFCLSDHRARDFDAVQTSITTVRFFPQNFWRRGCVSDWLEECFDQLKLEESSKPRMQHLLVFVLLIHPIRSLHVLLCFPPVAPSFPLRPSPLTEQIKVEEL